ncbi:MAG: DUF4258 domain-containing protein [Anaerolineae bacterium]
MPIEFSDHALARMIERGATKEEIEETIELGSQESLPNGRSLFRKSFDYHREWNGKYYRLKHLEVRAAYSHPNWVIITVIVKYSI